MARRKSFGARFGARLRARRQAAGWSQAQLAEKVELTPNYVGILERGAKLPTIETLVGLAKALGVGPGELLDEQPGKDDWLDEAVGVLKSIRGDERALALRVLKAIASGTDD